MIHGRDKNIEEANFTNEMKNMDFIDQKVRDEASKNIRKDKEGRDAMIANTEILINALNEADPELLPAYLKLTNNNLELFGFHYRGLDAGKKKTSTGLPGERYEDHKRLLELVLEGS
ncbi:hypothetical protein CL617_01185, partial [archaeon]|nr:hypothetical protein [archaeon]